MNITWKPVDSFKNSEINKFKTYVENKTDLTTPDYQTLWKWSVDNIENFWQIIVQYFDIQFDGFISPSLIYAEARPFYTAEWFPGLCLSYAEHVFRNRKPDDVAILFENEAGDEKQISWRELEAKVIEIVLFLKSKDLKTGDRLVAYMSNKPETVALFLAANSMGLIWSVVSPDFGVESVVDRFKQIEPSFLFFHKKQTYNGKTIDKSSEIEAMIYQLTSLKGAMEVSDFDTFFIKTALEISLEFERVPFSHPIWILFSSGTTGKPKAITHSTGGVLLEHLKILVLHQEVVARERFFWYSTTGWMMWNYAVSSLLCGAILCLYDGSPGYPSADRLWKFVEHSKIDHFGAGAAYFIFSQKNEIKPCLSLKSIGSTGSPLPASVFDYFRKCMPDSPMISLSGGTDICSAFVSGCALRPVVSGQIQCRTLGVALEAFDDEGQAVYDQIGELVILKPMPSMPIYFWKDDEYKRYHESYFEHYEGVWTHGDYIRITPEDGVIIYGRSDATLNKGGVRIGTAEFYNVLEQISYIEDSLIVNPEFEPGFTALVLFLKVKKSDLVLENQHFLEVKNILTRQCSPRHSPDLIVQVQDIPYTMNGKKMEIPVRKILQGQNAQTVAQPGSMHNPESLLYFENLRDDVIRKLIKR